MSSQKSEPPPSFTALQQHTLDNYAALAEAMGLLPDGITVDELIVAASNLKAHHNALRKRADSYEAAVAEIADILEQPTPVWAEGSELWALPLWRGINRLKEDLKKAERFIGDAEKLVEGLTAGFTERIEQLEAELKLARANESIAVLNEETQAQFHEAVENETRDKFQVRAAKWKYRLLKAMRLIRKLQTELELSRAEAEFGMSDSIRALAEYDRLTLALAYKWGDAKKKRFLERIKDDVYMAKLESRWMRRFPDEAGERHEA